MAQVLVLVDHVEGSVRKTTTELLTIARRLGEPAAVFIGEGYEAAAPTLAEYGAATVYTIDGDVEGYLVAAKAEALAAVVEQAGGASALAGVLMTSNSETKEIAGRLSVKLGAGLITDAVDVQEGAVATKSVFSAGYTTKAKVTLHFS